jgi:hypothetical protein
MHDHPLNSGAASNRSINAPTGRLNLARVLPSVLSLLLAISLIAPANAAGERPAFPSIRLPAKARGTEAVRQLGANVGGVAAWYGMTPERLTEILEKDSDAWLDETGHLLFIDQFPPVPEDAGAIDDSGSVLDPGPYPLSDTFKLHSKPGAQRVIYLDFDGHTATGSAWNSGTIVAPPFDLDGIVSTAFSSTELNRIQMIWQRVAEDYAPFNVDVTTEEPAPDLLNRTSSLDQLYGTRAVITHSSIGVCTGCGGIAYVGVFNWYSSTKPTYYQPAWVLYDKLGSGNEKSVAEAISHEVGHNLGLSHDGTSTDSYYAGHGSGVTSWAPIMGVGYSKNVVQWSKGEYTGANNTEDDMAVIQNYGAPLKADAVGNTKETATPLGGTTTDATVSVSAGGVIETRTDVDVFSFSSGAGPLKISVNAGLRSPNMDIALELLDKAGNVIAASNPATDLNATLNVTLSAGSYFLRIDGVGYGNPSNNGYSDYASIGRYTISGTYTAPSVLTGLTGLAAQGYVGTDNEVQFGAFTISGAPRKVLIRGLGPALDDYVPGAIRNPRISLSLNGVDTPMEVNDDWGLAANAAEISALKHQPKNATESAILRTLEPGIYNVHLSGSGGSTGIGMFQVYAVDGGGNGELKGLAAQGLVGTGNQVQFGTFTISGTRRKVLIRGLGPTLDSYIPGAIQNPRITLSLNGADTPLEVNDDWGTAGNAAEIAALKHQPAYPVESAILRTLEPGIYNVHLSGSGGSTGIGMFQVYTVE